MSVRTKVNHCPSCGIKLDGATNPHDPDLQPKPSDYGVVAI